MQSAKKAVESMKETAANVGASAKAGMEKTKATIQEKVNSITLYHIILYSDFDDKRVFNFLLKVFDE